MSDYMPFASVLRQNYVDYLLYLDHGGDRFRFEEKREEHPGLVHCSALMDCPLKASKERSQTEATFPEFLKQNNPSVLHRMQLGVRSAEAFQESLLFGATLTRENSPFDYAQVESSIFSDEWMLQGRRDGWLREKGIPKSHWISHVIEVKHRLPPHNQKMGQPRMGDVFQMLAYKVMGCDDEANLIILNTPSYKDFFNEDAMMEVWTLIQDSDHIEGYKLVSEHGYEWQHPQNNGTFINVREMREEIARQLDYLEGETTPPIDLHQDEAWQCRKINYYPKNGGKGLFTPVCPYWCITSPDEARNGMNYTVNEDSTWNLEYKF